MAYDLHAGDFGGLRRAARIGVELPVRCKHGLTRSTVMLKDLTPFGARVEGIGPQREGEPITLLMPGLSRAMTGFVVWSDPACSGLEFDLPLGEDEFAQLIADYAIGQADRVADAKVPVRRFAA